MHYLKVSKLKQVWGNHKVVGANGNEVTSSNHLGNLNPFRYRGYYYDVETGLYFLKSRYYDPEVGRFLNMDSIIFADNCETNGINLYAYCLNNPVNYIDPFGKFVILSTTAAIGLLCAGLFAIFVSPIVVDAAGDLAESIVDSVESINIPDVSDAPDINIGNSSTADGEKGNSPIASASKRSIVESVKLGLLSGLAYQILLSRERNRGRDSGFIGKSNDDLIDELGKAKNAGNSEQIMRILKEMKMRGMRNKQKNRNNPHMRGWWLFFLLFDLEEDRY